MGDTGTVDQDLVKRVQRGDKTAFDLLVRKYQYKVIKLVSRYVYDPSDAHDVAQEAFIKAYRALPGFRGDSAFYTWLYRIAINTAKNHVAARNRTPISAESEFGNEDSDGDFSSRLSDIDTPEALLLTDEVRRTIMTAIEGLPQDLRTALILREIEGMSYDEIAKTMDCPVGTVRSRLFRARDTIDAELKKIEGLAGT
ncbi:RNA polymerase sigma factor RpoE [Candidatus Macondimonas diazotrophica]|jgi:RNA polymerase sigma-70 factor (ECF subfamily)|uniref:RNA polymerase sigma factor RpoE n=1 Tax=Candidatus Macondimonas diazotrophica TaxID=2305248 RepID=A0A4Z0FA62_9GAMM|nr:RNA polymerase sigma factor RpoE [Candidatus Macondimonas diazotrophica]NCU00798.1 RNA polymerase sigma factor RpoE [Candidatus Macondimonas diazotrophica]TFZ82600.1 RNA polymerase sigma factor RpoE [Candidatus Macondimonas diazotrophica]HBG32008.1 RNA polymerase sigma factor RpoE [Gammaproteobacteria bacterium]HBG52341.1 RNA polymerase sigma factor RpoE [Gammaproteobacteria bacterium]